MDTNEAKEFSEEAEDQSADKMDMAGEEENDSAIVTELKQKRTFLNRLFDKETRLGRFMRLFIRWLVIIGVCFCAGVITAYFVLYQPIKNSLDDTKANLVEIEKERDSLKTQLEKAQTDIAGLEEKYNQLEEASNLQSTYVLFLELDNRVRGMMYAVSINDLVTAKVMMGDAKKFMTSLQPFVAAKQSDLASLVQSRLNVAASELEMNNGEGALEDLQRLRESLNLVAEALFTE